MADLGRIRLDKVGIETLVLEFQGLGRRISESLMEEVLRRRLAEVKASSGRGYR